jgi:hypothetical protein
LNSTQSTDTKGKAPTALSNSGKGKKPGAILSNKLIYVKNLHSNPTQYLSASRSNKAAPRLLICPSYHCSAVGFAAIREFSAHI